LPIAASEEATLVDGLFSDDDCLNGGIFLIVEVLRFTVPLNIVVVRVTTQTDRQFWQRAARSPMDGDTGDYCHQDFYL